MKVVSVDVESDLYVAGRTEDGEEYTAEVYFVCVEIAGGEIYAHRERFQGCKVEEWADEDDCGTAFIDVRQAAKAAADCLADRVKARVDAGGNLDMTQWMYRRTRYGSNAYLDEVAEMTPRQRAGEPD